MKKITLITASLVTAFSISGFSQAAGGSCASITYDLASGCTGMQTINDITTEASIPAISSPTPAASFESDGWYWYSVPAGPPQNVTITATSMFGTNDLIIQLFSGTCASLTEIGCANADPTQSINQTETVTVPGLSPGLYFVRFSNWGSTSNMKLSDACATMSTGIDEENAALSFSIYPNPSGSVVSFVFRNELDDAVINVFDVLGKSLMSLDFEGSDLTLDFSAFGKGVYFVQVAENGASTTRKVILK